MFDLSINYNFITADLQDNLIELDNKFGNQFMVKYLDHILPVRLEKSQIDTSKVKFYKLFYDYPHRTTRMKPFSIYFLDPNTSELNSNSYIANIHKTDIISGSDMIRIVLEINRKLNVKKTSLNDGAHITCNEKNTIDLSFFKLIEYGLTFYMKFGFEFEINNKEFFDIHFDNIKQLKTKLHELIGKIRKIKVKSIISEYEKTMYILAHTIKTQAYDDFSIELFYGGSTYKPQELYEQDDPNKQINQLFIECHTVLDILNRTNRIYLYEYLIDLFNNPVRCVDYMILINYLAETDRHSVRIGKISVKRSYPQLFDYLTKIRYRYSYVYHFD